MLSDQKQTGDTTIIKPIKPTKPTIAIAGCTGALGSHIANTLLSDPYRDKFHKIVVLSRNDTVQTEAFTQQGAKHITHGDRPHVNYLRAALQDVTIFVNAISSAGAKLRDAMVKVLPETGVKLYFPSEFGVDHMLHDFEMQEWDGKKAHFKLAKEICEPAGIKVCRVFIGLFVEDAFEQCYGYGPQETNVKTKQKRIVIEAVGSFDAVVSYTSLHDVGKVISVLGTEMAVSEVPEELRLAGSSASMWHISKAIYEQYLPDDTSLVWQEKDGLKMKQELIAEKSTDPLKYLRFLMGDGSIDYRSKQDGGLGNDNDVVNPDQKRFKWLTWQDQLAGKNPDELSEMQQHQQRLLQQHLPLQLRPNPKKLTPEQMNFMDQVNVHRMIIVRLNQREYWSKSVKTWAQLKQWLQQHPEKTLPITRIENIQAIQFRIMVEARKQQQQTAAGLIPKLNLPGHVQVIMTKMRKDRIEYYTQEVTMEKYGGNADLIEPEEQIETERLATIDAQTFAKAWQASSPTTVPLPAAGLPPQVQIDMARIRDNRIGHHFNDVAMKKYNGSFDLLQPDDHQEILRLAMIDVKTWLRSWQEKEKSRLQSVPQQQGGVEHAGRL